MNPYFYAALISACGAATPPDLKRAETAVHDLVKHGLRPQSVKRALARVLGMARVKNIFARLAKQEHQSFSRTSRHTSKKSSADSYGGTGTRGGRTAAVVNREPVNASPSNGTANGGAHRANDDVFARVLSTPTPCSAADHAARVPDRLGCSHARRPQKCPSQEGSQASSRRQYRASKKR